MSTLNSGSDSETGPEQDEYERAYKARDEAMAVYSLAHQRWMHAQMLLDEAAEDLRHAERRLAKAVGLTPEGRRLP